MSEGGSFESLPAMNDTCASTATGMWLESETPHTLASNSATTSVGVALHENVPGGPAVGQAQQLGAE